MRLPWSFPVRLGGSRSGGLPDQWPLAQFPLWPSLFASMRFMGPGEYRRPRERALRVPSVSVVPLAIPTRSRASWAQTTRRQCRSSTAGFYSPYRTRGERKSGDLPRLSVGVGAFGSQFAKHTRGNKRRRGAGEGFCDPTHRDPRPAWRRLRGKSGFFKTAATAGGCISHPTNVDQLVVNMNREVRVDIGRVFDAPPPLQPPPRAGFWEASPAALPPLVTAAGLYRFL